MKQTPRNLFLKHYQKKQTARDLSFQNHFPASKSTSFQINCINNENAMTSLTENAWESM